MVGTAANFETLIMAAGDEVLVDVPWDFMVFSYQDRWILTYFVQAPRSYCVSIALTAREVAGIRAGLLCPEKIVADCRLRRTEYQWREIHPAVWPA